MEYIYDNICSVGKSIYDMLCSSWFPSLSSIPLGCPLKCVSSVALLEQDMSLDIGNVGDIQIYVDEGAGDSSDDAVLTWAIVVCLVSDTYCHKLWGTW